MIAPAAQTHMLTVFTSAFLLPPPVDPEYVLSHGVPLSAERLPALIPPRPPG